MPKYRKKPVVIEAVRITEPMTVETLEGGMRGEPGDWLITGVKGELYLCKDDIFRQTYEPVEEDGEPTQYVVCKKCVGWLSNNFIVTNAKDNCIITTPYKRPDGDFIEVKLVEEGGKSYLTDNGGTYDYLFISGMDLLSPSDSREMLIRTILNSNGVTLYNDVELAVELNEDIDMGLAMSKLIRAINSLQNLIYTTRPTGVRFFPEKEERNDR